MIVQCIYAATCRVGTSEAPPVKQTPAQLTTVNMIEHSCYYVEPVSANEASGTCSTMEGIIVDWVEANQIDGMVLV